MSLVQLSILKRKGEVYNKFQGQSIFQVTLLQDSLLFAKMKWVIPINLCFSDKDDQKGRNQVHRGLSIVRLLNEFCRRLNVTVMKCEKKPYTSQVKKVLWCLAPAWVLRVLIISFCQLYGKVKK